MRRVLVAAMSASVLVASGCSFDGINSMPIPGAQGTDSGAYEITAMIPNAAGLVTNGPVMIDDATVGSIGSLAVKDWHAQVTIRLNQGTQVPRGSHVMVGITSVLGSSHLQIVQPEKPQGGYLSAGDEIPLAKCPEQNNIAAPEGAKPIPDITAAQQVSACTYPTTEQVLSSLSVVLNGGGLSQLGDAVHEINAVFGGRQEAIRKLVPALNTLVADLSAQKDNIISAIDGLNRLSDTINQQTPTVEKALADGPKILQLLVDQREQFTGTLDSLARLSKTSNDIIKANDKDIKTIVANLDPVLDQLQSTGPALTKALGLMLTFPFIDDTIPSIARGDYVNGDLILDLTFDRVKSTILSSSGLVGPEGVVGAPAGAARRGLNPFTSPLQPGGGTPRDKLKPPPPVKKPADRPTTRQGGGN